MRILLGLRTCAEEEISASSGCSPVGSAPSSWRCEISGEGRLPSHVAAGENASRSVCYFRKAEKDGERFQRTKKIKVGWVEG